MPTNDRERVELRREAYDLNESLVSLAMRLKFVDPEAEMAVTRARSALFEAWTILCVPAEDDDDH